MRMRSMLVLLSWPGDLAEVGATGPTLRRFDGFATAGRIGTGFIPRRCSCHADRGESDRRQQGIGEKSMQRSDDLRALTDRAADTLDRAGPDIADRVDTWHG